jgi:hypothetical protein
VATVVKAGVATVVEIAVATSVAAGESEPVGDGELPASVVEVATGDGDSVGVGVEVNVGVAVRVAVGERVTVGVNRRAVAVATFPGAPGSDSHAIPSWSPSIPNGSEPGPPFAM